MARSITYSTAFALILVLAVLAVTAAAAEVLQLWHDPADSLYNEDRVDIFWTFDPGVDSVRVDFGDGEAVMASSDATPLRHVYRDAGRYDLTLTLWENGAPTLHEARNFAVVRQRPIPGDSYMFVHHSTGRNLIRDSGVRSRLDLHNEQTGTSIRFWDHDYDSGNTYTGIIEPDSTVHSDWSYGEEANDITPHGYWTIFCGNSAFRDSLFNRHDVILLKNDHSTGDIDSDAQLAAYVDDYLQIRDVLDQYPEKRFVLVSGPPRRPEDTTNARSDRARAFYDWLQGPGFMNGHPNISFFDLFDLLAYPDDPDDPERNMLRLEYRRPYGLTDSHPNEYANSVIGPQFADMLIRIVDPTWIREVTPAVPPAAGLRLLPNRPNPFNPATVITFELERAGPVRLEVFDLSGRRVRRILDSTRTPAGRYAHRWDGLDERGRAQPSGMYLYRLTSGAEVAGRRMTLVR